MHAGKTTAAEFLISRYGYRRLSFAEPVKVKSVDMLNAGRFRDEAFTREELDANKSVFRPLLQWVGTELGREYVGNENYWVDMLAEQIGASDAPVVIDDVRFPSEWAFLTRHNFAMLFVDRREDLRFRTFVERQGGDYDDDAPVEMSAFADKWVGALAHPSEPVLSLIQEHVKDLYLLHNNSDPDCLYMQLQSIVEHESTLKRSAYATIASTSI